MASDALVDSRAAQLSKRPRSTRLRRDGDVRAVLRDGHASHGRHLSAHVRPTPGTPRSTVIAGRKVGGAVQRNAAKRRLRAVLQTLPLPEGHDVVLVARSRMRCLSHEELRAAVAEQVRRATYGCAAAAPARRAGGGRRPSPGGR